MLALKQYHIVMQRLRGQKVGCGGEKAPLKQT